MKLKVRGPKWCDRKRKNAALAIYVRKGNNERDWQMKKIFLPDL